MQVVRIRAGERPKGRRADWGHEAAARWGTLSVNGESRKIPSLQGDYTNYYDRFAEAIATGAQDRCQRKRASRFCECWTPRDSAPLNIAG